MIGLCGSITSKGSDNCQYFEHGLHRRIPTLALRISAKHSLSRYPTPTLRLCRTQITVTVNSQAEMAATTTHRTLPRSAAAQVKQAADTIRQALSDNILRQRIDFILPVNEKESNFMNTEAMDYPCSLQKEFDVTVSLTSTLLQRLSSSSSSSSGVKVAVKRIDDGGVEGEPCAIVYPEDSKDIVAVVFPTSDRLKQIQDLAKETDRPCLIVNPQWREAGQVISDFGIGPWKKAALDFLAQFEQTYIHRETRIGSPGTINAASGTRFNSGGVIRLLRQYPTGGGDWEVHAMAANGASQLLSVVKDEPGYKDMEGLLDVGRKGKLEIFEVAKAVTDVYKTIDDDGDDDEMKEELDDEGRQAASREVSDLTLGDIDTLDAASVRRILISKGLPASGKLAKLKERLKESL